MVKHAEMTRVRNREAYQAFHNDMHVKIAKAVNDRDRYVGGCRYTYIHT